MYYVYMLRCEDNSIYTGITNDLQRRMDEHFNKTKKCAKYTMQHKAKKLECVFETLDRVSASKLEYHIKKHLTKIQKEQLIKQQIELSILSDKIDKENYTRIKL